PSGMCLTCEYRSRVGRQPGEPGGTLAFGGDLSLPPLSPEPPPAGAPFEHGETVELGGDDLAEPGSTRAGVGGEATLTHAGPPAGGTGSLRTGRLGFASAPVNLPYAAEQVIG